MARTIMKNGQNLFKNFFQQAISRAISLCFKKKLGTIMIGEARSSYYIEPILRNSVFCAL